MNAGRARVCARCGRRPGSFDLPGGAICLLCCRYLAYHPDSCPACSQRRPLTYPSTTAPGQMICAGCAGQSPVFVCDTCGRHDHPYKIRHCARCVLTVRLSALLRDPSTGEVHERLRPVFDELVGSARPQNAITWLQRPPGHGPEFLRQMATGEVAISHETFAGLPMTRARNYLRDLLVALDVLEPYEPLIERIEPWLAGQVTGLGDLHRQTIEQFARWVILRRLRTAAERGTLTEAMAEGTRQRLSRSIDLLVWLEHENTTIVEATQSRIELYLADQPASMPMMLHPFATWLNRTGINNSIQIRNLAPTKAQVTMGDADRWRRVSTLLHDDSIVLYTRVIGLFILLFAQPITRACALRTDQVQAPGPGPVFVTFQTTPVEMPEPLGDLIRQQLTRSGNASHASRDNGWLFPGGIPGRPLAAENVRGHLVSLGIPPPQARHGPGPHSPPATGPSTSQPAPDNQRSCQVTEQARSVPKRSQMSTVMRSRTRDSMSSRMTRTASRPWLAGSSSCQSS